MILLSGVVYSDNSSGPSTDPWGTPWMSLLNLDGVESFLLA